MQGSFEKPPRQGRGCPMANDVARMRLLPHETTAIRAVGPRGDPLRVRVRNEDVNILQKLASGGWIPYVVSDVIVLISSKTPNTRLELSPFESCTFTIPLKRKTRKLPGEKTDTPSGSTEISLTVASIRMLPGKGSSLAHRAIVTLCLA